jgi:hypothetical protein
MQSELWMEVMMVCGFLQKVQTVAIDLAAAAFGDITTSSLVAVVSSSTIVETANRNSRSCHVTN